MARRRSVRGARPQAHDPIRCIIRRSVIDPAQHLTGVHVASWEMLSIPCERQRTIAITAAYHRVLSEAGATRPLRNQAGVWPPNAC